MYMKTRQDEAIFPRCNSSRRHGIQRSPGRYRDNPFEYYGLLCLHQESYHPLQQTTVRLYLEAKFLVVTLRDDMDSFLEYCAFLCDIAITPLNTMVLVHQESYHILQQTAVRLVSL